MKVYYYKGAVSDAEEIKKRFVSALLRGKDVAKIDKSFLEFIKNPDNITAKVHYTQALAVRCKMFLGLEYKQEVFYSATTGYTVSDVREKWGGGYEVDVKRNTEQRSTIISGAHNQEFSRTYYLCASYNQTRAASYSVSDNLALNTSRYSTSPYSFLPAFYMPGQYDDLSLYYALQDKIKDYVDYDENELRKYVTGQGDRLISSSVKVGYRSADCDWDTMACYVYPIYTVSLYYKGKRYEEEFIEEIGNPSFDIVYDAKVLEEIKKPIIQKRENRIKLEMDNRRTVKWLFIPSITIALVTLIRAIWTIFVSFDNEILTSIMGFALWPAVIVGVGTVIFGIYRISEISKDIDSLKSQVEQIKNEKDLEVLREYSNAHFYEGGNTRLDTIVSVVEYVVCLFFIVITFIIR